jgi:hypothetical protein
MHLIVFSSMGSLMGSLIDGVRAEVGVELVVGIVLLYQFASLPAGVPIHGAESNFGIGAEHGKGFIDSC